MCVTEIGIPGVPHKKTKTTNDIGILTTKKITGMLFGKGLAWL